MRFDSADIALLIAIAMVLCASRSYAAWILRQDAAKAQRYNLYRVRDNLVYLVATGKLSESDLIFQTFYKAANYYSSSVDKITLSRLVNRIIEARAQGLDPSENKKMEVIRAALEHQDKEVVDVVRDFYESMMAILIQNSPFLKIVFGVHFIRSLLGKLAEVNKRITMHRRAYWFYQDYSRAASRL
jgi:hypothetical protein